MLVMTDYDAKCRFMPLQLPNPGPGLVSRRLAGQATLQVDRTPVHGLCPRPSNLIKEALNKRPVDKAAVMGLNESMGEGTELSLLVFALRCLEFEGTNPASHVLALHADDT